VQRLLGIAKRVCLVCGCMAGVRQRGYQGSKLRKATRAAAVNFVYCTAYIIIVLFYDAVIVVYYDNTVLTIMLLYYLCICDLMCCSIVRLHCCIFVLVAVFYCYRNIMVLYYYAIYCAVML
jgi:hypothetical protein